VAARLHKMRQQALYGAAKLLREPLLLRYDPLLVVTGEQFAPIEVDRAACGLEIVRIAQGSLELRDIGGDGERLKVHGISVGAQDASGFHSGRLQKLPQRRERHAEAVASCFGRDTGPETRSGSHGSGSCVGKRSE